MTCTRMLSYKEETFMNTSDTHTHTHSHTHTQKEKKNPKNPISQSRKQNTKQLWLSAFDLLPSAGEKKQPR